MQVEIRTITPKEAGRLLSNNPNNRSLSKPRVVILARDMCQGRWQLNGDAIRLNTDGAVIDGQHRLAGCVESRVSFQTLVITGLPDAVRSTIDSGAKRTLGDRFKIAGLPNANCCAAACLSLHTLAHRSYRSSASHSELEEIMERHPGISDSASLCRHAFPKSGSRLTSIHYIGRYLGYEEEADDFISVWKAGIPSYEGDPAHLAREKLIKIRGTAQQPTGEVVAKLIAHSWNLFSARKSVSRIHYPQDYAVTGWTPECLGNPKRFGM